MTVNKKARPQSDSPAARLRRKQVYDLRKAEHDWEQISAITGLTVGSAQTYLTAAYDQDGLPRLPKMARKTYLETHEEAAATIAAKMANPFDEKFEKLREECRKHGMKPSLVTAVIRRMQKEYFVPLSEMKKITVAEMTDKIEKNINLIISSIDEYDVATASLKDKAVATGVLIDRHQLLSGKPTQIIDVTARMQLQQLMPAMLAEAARRGISQNVPLVERVDAAK